MTEEQLQALKYPIGEFAFPKEATKNQIENWISQIKEFPKQIEATVSSLTDLQLDTPYRPDGWTVRQVVHHVVDSHINSYIRFKWALTEDEPLIKVYDEKTWAELPEAKTSPIDLSLGLLDNLHRRWVVVLQNLSESELRKTFIHPEMNNKIYLYQNIALYAWHCEHHLAHITKLKERNDWR